MKKPPKLSIILSPKELTNSNNFWKTCKRSLEYLPSSPCESGKPSVNQKSNRVSNEPNCLWWINSTIHNFCFWTYVNDKSTIDGVMPELVQSDLAKLFGWSNTKTHFALKEAIRELTDALIEYKANDLIEEPLK